MVCSSCTSDSEAPKTDPRWRSALWIALAVNASMFAVEIVAGVSGGSRALQADALDLLGDAANYAISLAVAGRVLTWRARAALAKGATLALLGLYVLASSLWAVWHGGLPHAETMGLVGVVALIANGAVAIMLFRFRSGDANMRSVWICSRNDAIGNAAVVLAALGVFGTGTHWPDILVAIVMAALGLWGAAARSSAKRSASYALRYARSEHRPSLQPQRHLVGPWRAATDRPVPRPIALGLCGTGRDGPRHGADRLDRRERSKLLRSFSG